MKQRIAILAGLLSLVCAPMVGGLLAGLPTNFFAFPPLVERNPSIPGFSWPIFSAFLVVDFIFVAALLLPKRFGFGQRVASMAGQKDGPVGTKCILPWWGVTGLALTAATWAVAWGRFEWSAPLNNHTFFPLWLGYILTVDGVVYARRGSSMLSRTPFTFAGLFPVSAVSWWYFEYLNRFMQNWWYEAVAPLSPANYIMHATMCFSTVLPAVFETWHLLATTSWFQTHYVGGPRVRISGRAAWAWLLAGTALLVLLGRFPAQTFFLAWVAPLMVLSSCLVLAGRPNPLGTWDVGNYRRVAALAVAALICGLFWETWNYWSLPQWNYSVPYVGRFHLFEMPVVGFGGYFPFGLICWCCWLAWCGLGPSKGGGESAITPPEEGA